MYYRNFFHGYGKFLSTQFVLPQCSLLSVVDHQNFVGIDEKLGPVAISFRREKVDDKERETTTGKMEGGGACHQYRLIVRTGELECLRGSVIEEAIPSSSRLSNTRGLPPKDVLEFLFPDEINLSSLKVASASNAASIGEQLLKLDEQRVSLTYKVGVLLCRAGQQTEEEMYNNEHGSPAFDEFLDCIGERVPLKGFEKYRGGLDCKTDSTGTHSLYKQIDDYEIMFHVSTMLPFTPNNRQQLLRKRHIGNDIVTIVFQEPGSLPFTPKSVRSHFQHIFIIVKAHHPKTEHVKYSLAVTRSKDVPPFGPLFSEGAMFSKSLEFARFLAIKVINGENAVHCSEKFLAMARRTRQEYMKELVNTNAGTTSLDSASKLSKFSLGSGRRKERPKVRTVPDVFATGAVSWSVQVTAHSSPWTEDFGTSSQLDAHLGIGSTLLVLIDVATKRVLSSIACKLIIGWTANGRSLRIYYNNNECIMIRMPPSEVDEIREVVTRLSLVTRGAQTEEFTLRRNSLGQLGFHVHFEGIISEIEQHGFAWNVGLRNGARLVEICKVATCTLTHDQMIDLLRTSVTVKVVVIPPYEDGAPRRFVVTPLVLYISSLCANTSIKRL
ncbi:hypothetical protein CAPTEDRAFT_146981 [Capitella teleta]|uniref:Rap-GAP domain-containing protein n=1 Tax=Capitella teleta TaxID=283909 RepID=R7TXC8_CAPTE|nr:hypothetical protein CAPTEDRAFT_146981 [Capitella teleta]|eukprot:ELT98588.1 hypothetical protein CAPTEDRAFT_146981 [Capitella teleta]